MKAFVTGGAGAIGSNLVAALLKDQDFKHVVVLDDLSSGYAENLPKHDKLTFIHDSVTNDAILKRIFSEYHCDAVFHLAANFANQNSVDFPRKDLDVNGVGTLKILEYAREYNVKRLVYSSSSCVYGNMGGVLNENTREFSVDTPYAITKLLGERYVKFFHEYYGMETVILRYFNTYGPGERPGKYRNVIPNFIHWAMQDQALPITGDGSETRDFNFNADTVAGTIAAMKSPEAPGKIFNLASGKETSILRIAEIINEVTGNSAGIKIMGRRKWDKVDKRLASITNAQQYLDYRPTVSIEDGIERTYEWIVALGLEKVPLK